MSNRYAYLVCVNATANNYKYYEMESDGVTLVCKYGRVNATCTTKTYPAGRFDSIYRQKIGKGYEDKTEFYKQQAVYVKGASQASKDTLKQTKGITDEQFELYELLAEYTNKTIREVFANGGTITRAMVEAAKRCINELHYYADIEDLDSFNQNLMDLMTICPRNVNGRGRYGVAAWLAYDISDLKRILDREESLLQTMESKVSYCKKAVNSSGDEAGYISDKVKEATPAQVEEVNRHLPKGLRDKVLRVYRVIPEKKSKEYKKWCMDNDIHRTKLLWHGSRNENWLSIIENSLQLRPNAVITGKMFGYGIYFAPDAMKSWGYTSSGKWTGGHAPVNIMGLYETAYGKPYDCYYSEQMTQQHLDDLGCNCLHAHKKTGTQGTLYSDEIVYYHENAVCLKYIVIFRG